MKIEQIFSIIDLKRMGKVIVSLMLFVTTLISPFVNVNYAQGRVFIKPNPTVMKTARAVEAAPAVRKAFQVSRLPRQSISPVFNNAAKSTLMRENINTSLRTAGITKRTATAGTGSMTRPVKSVQIATKLPAVKTATFGVGRTTAQNTVKNANKDVYDIRKLMYPNLTPKERVIVGNALNSANSRAAAATAIEKQAVNLEKLFNAKAALHKNSRFYRGTTHVYVIVAPDGRIYKVGESGRKLLNNGLSSRAQSQVNKLNKNLQPGSNETYRSRVISTFDSKTAAREYERNLIQRYERKYKDKRLVLPGNRERFRLQNKGQEQKP